MNESARQTGPVAVYGATGYTGRLIASELAARGADFVLAGRNQAKLRELASKVAGASTVAVSLDDEAGMQELLEPCAAVISCAGSPFVANGEPVIAAAIAAGTHYLDTTGEQPFMRTVFDRHGPAAADAGVALVSAMGFDYVPGDMIASLTAKGMGRLDEIEIAYYLSGFGPSRGTSMSTVEMLSGGDAEWRDGALRPAGKRVSRGRFEFPAPIGSQRMTRYPSGEPVTVPRHVETDNVRTSLSASAVVPYPRLEPLTALAGPMQLALRSGAARRLVDSAVARLPEGPSESERRAARFTVACEARAGARVRSGSVSGSDVYGLTASIATEGALRCAVPGYDRRGALAPSQAYDAHDFLSSLAPAGVRFEVEPG